MAKEAQAEGFRSPMEMEEAAAQAEARAKQLGIPANRILGGTKANFEGEYKISEQDKRKQKALYQKYMEKGLLAKDIKGAARAKRELQDFERGMAKKHKGARKYKPTLSKADARSQARAQQKLFGR
jgi:hypothetical protein